ncbi:MAG: polymer-forming cytoskeletal protein [Lachnospiraceae bacterium]|nr:polymer-forming cytoskeletal protein [Lachnospiraceae bacterium]
MLFRDEAAIKIKESSITSILSPDVVINGSLSSAESIRFNGKITGDLSSRGLIIIGKNAAVRGNITADSVIVAGVVEGNLNAQDKVNIEATGEVYGDIVTRKLLIDEESVFSGQCTMLRDEKSSRKREAAIKKAEEAVRKANERSGRQADADDHKEIKPEEPEKQPEEKEASEKPQGEPEEAVEEKPSDDDFAFIDLGTSKPKKRRSKRR